MNYHLSKSIAVILVMCARILFAREPFDFDWRFARGDFAGAELEFFDDSKWEAVDLPHDFMIAGPFEGKDSKSGTKLGFRPLGVGWYRKAFVTPPEISGRKMWLHFEGIYRAPKVWVNGALVAEWLNGYMWRYVDITAHLKPAGQTNIVAVRADNSLPDTSRWYTGGGIYRHVWLVTAGTIHIVQDGVFVTTPKVSTTEALVKIQTEVKNGGKTVTLCSEVLDADSKIIGKIESTGATPVFEQQLIVKEPKLWDLNKPTMYRLLSRVIVDDKETDRYETPFGIRDIKITPNGLFLNGQRVFVKGFCLHHDLGCLGAAAFDRAIERRLQTMKAMGVNGIRLSHNPYSSSLLDMADRMGFLIFDEAFDDWSDEFYTDPANVPDYKVLKKSPSLILDQFNKNAKTDLAMFVRRDRNHPSIFIWSIGNEVGWAYRPPDYGIKLYNELAPVLKANDPTRPVTTALRVVRHNAAKNEALETCEEPHQLGLCSDVMSANYMEKFFTRDRRRHPDLAFISSESFTGQGGRKAYAAMDLEHSVGMFFWGAVNYLGESQRWPFKSWKNGFVERTGLIKPAGYDAMTYFNDKPSVHLAIMDGRLEAAIMWEEVLLVQNQMESHWNFANFKKKLTVEAYSNCDEVELLLNGKSLGTKTREGAPGLGPRLTWDIAKFEPGTLLAIGRKAGKEVARHELKTAGTPKALRLIPDQTVLKADGQDIAHIRVEVVDTEGIINPDAKNLITFTVTGPGTNAGVDNGNPASDELFQANQRHAHQGIALLVIRSKRQAGEIVVKAESEGLDSAKITFSSHGKFTYNTRCASDITEERT